MKYQKGNLLSAPVEALVNTVNTVGVMGKGIALQFKERFPQNFQAYKKACSNGEMQIGTMFMFTEATTDGEKIIINFPTKREWYRKSQYNFIEEGLKDLAKVLKEKQIKSIAIPPLGCGNGGLNWNIVKQMIEKYLADINGVEIIVFEPDEAVKEVLQKEQISKHSKLTNARAMLLYALFWYEQFGEDTTVFTANKIAYLLQESGENLKLSFVQHHYGPYAQAVEKVLYALNGTYLSGLEQMTAKPFEPLQLNYNRKEEVDEYVANNLSSVQNARLNNVFKLLTGFESTFSLELLTSVYYLMSHEKLSTPEKLSQAIKSWNQQKATKITDEYIQIAFDHINKRQPQLQLDFS